MSIVSERVRCIRTEHKLTQGLMAEKIGMKPSSYQNYESAQSFPPILVLVNIAIKFNISIDYLTGRCDEKKKIQQVYDVENRIPFSSRLRELRNKSGMTQTETAKAIGLTQRATYVCYERAEKEPSLPRLIALADLFDVSLDYLVGFNEK